ncbi:MAG: hypothetical protein KAJ01_11120, partial [Candidatus Hydrogenedentes bacterium]|nr:hypothetical protein [Candidatus Hydrogenedentota bacterium]
LTQRYFKLSVPPDGGKVLMRLSNGDPLLVERRIGTGRVLWCTTTGSPRWTTFPTTGLFLPVVVRAALAAGGRRGADESYTADAPVTILIPQTNPPIEKISVTLPEQVVKPRVRVLPVDKKGAARFVETHDPGVYHWEGVGGEGPPGENPKNSAAGAFVVNPYGAESQLAAYTPSELKTALGKLGLERVYVGSSLEEVQAEAGKDSQGRNFWDVLIVLVVLLLVIEGVIANRRRANPTPAVAKKRDRA